MHRTWTSVCGGSYTLLVDGELIVSAHDDGAVNTMSNGGHSAMLVLNPRGGNYYRVIN